MQNDKEFQDAIKERFGKLPRVVQQAIVSADVSKHMRDLATEHKLHVDQWEALENEMQYTLLGIQAPADLPANLKKELGVDDATAAALSESISKNIFEPIRQQLERELEHPDSVAGHDTTAPADLQAPTPMLAAPVSAPVQATSQAIAPQVAAPTLAAPVPAAAPTISVVAPATPPAAVPTAKVERAPLSSSYMASQPSHERKVVEGDPYREQIA